MTKSLLLTKDNKALKEENLKLAAKVEPFKQYTRRDNLILRGILETKNKNTNMYVL